MTERDRNRFEVGGFDWCVDHVDLGDPVVSRLVRVICRDQTIWPEQLLGANGVPRDALSATHGFVPLSTGSSPEPRRESRFVYARRLLWRAVHESTEWSIENIAAMLGGYSVATVRPWATSWRMFERVYGREEYHRHNDTYFSSWRRFGPHMIDLLGLEMPEEYREWLDEPCRGVRPASTVAA